MNQFGFQHIHKGKLQLIDNHNREINYLRISVTDRCNLRCTYCMPEKGLRFEKKENLLSLEEIYRVVEVFTHLGVNKVRFTGGEPFVRDGLLDLFQSVSRLEGIDELTITTNGTILNENHLDILKKTKVKTINLSLDTLDQARFKEITRRDDFRTVRNNLELLLHSGFEIKINCVVMVDKNIDDIIPFLEFTKDHHVTVRFLEEMPFNGASRSVNQTTTWNHVKMLDYISAHYPHAIQLPVPKSSTSSLYQIPGYDGRFGIIPSYSRTFCGSCNRVRVSHRGEMRTCLYGQNVLNLRDMIRQGWSDEAIQKEIVAAVSNRAKDGFEAQANKEISESMTKIGG